MGARTTTTSSRDEFGRDLEITIRIARDGRVYFHDIPLGMIEIARALCPDDPDLQLREQAAQQMLSRCHDQQG